MVRSFQSREEETSPQDCEVPRLRKVEEVGQPSRTWGGVRPQARGENPLRKEEKAEGISVLKGAEGKGMRPEVVAAAVTATEELVRYRAMNVWEWAEIHWFLFFILVSMATVLTCMLVENLLNLFRRILRAATISIRG